MLPVRLTLLQPTTPTITELIARDGGPAFITGRRQRVKHTTLTFAAGEALLLGWWLASLELVEGVHYLFERWPPIDNQDVNECPGQLFLFEPADE